MSAVELIGVTKDYGRVRAVDDLTLRVPEGSLFGLIGPNGAGKTTTFALLSGFLRPTKGQVRVRGVPLSPGHPPVGRILALPQDASLLPSKRVHATLVLLARLGGMRGVEAAAKATEALGRVGLADLADRKVTQLSHGQRRRVGIAQTLMGTDEVIVLDEPTAGLDPRTALELVGLIKTLSAERTIVFSSHNLSEMEDICTHAAILDRGKLVAEGTMDEIRGTGARMKIDLVAPLSDPAGAQAALQALPGVSAVQVVGAGEALQITVSSEGEKDEALTNSLLRALMDQGATVKSMERGQRLTEKFMQATKGGN